jgi:peroxiredoxin
MLGARQRAPGYWLIVVAAGMLGILSSRWGLIGTTAPDFRLRDAYGGTVEMRFYRNKPLLLVFWTTSCPICRRELPVVDRLSTEFRSRAEVLAVNLGDVQGARDYMRETGLSLTNAIDEDGAAGRAYRVSGVPKLVLIDAGGKVIRQTSGFASEAVLREWFQTVTGS